MKKIISTLFLASGLLLSAQVGINTESPKARIDVNGDLNLRQKIVVLNSTDNSLSQGNNDQLLVSQGEGYAPIWKTLRIPEYEPNKFYLIFNNSFSDKVGITFAYNDEASFTTSKAATFLKGTDLGSLKGFRKIEGLSQDIDVFSTESKAYFQFETVVQADFSTVSNNSTDTAIDYACGIFVDNKLINLRQRNLKGINSAYPFLTHNQIGIVENLSKGKHKVSVACSRLASYGENYRKLSIGINTSTNINDFIAQSSLKVDVYEVPEVFNPIIVN
ncbi:hypothetical protein [Chryseobacterium sp. M5A1_1a]